MSNVTLENFKKSNNLLKALANSERLSLGEKVLINEQVMVNETIINFEEGK
jgi:hypothetical protein